MWGDNTNQDLIIICISYFFIVVTKHHDQGNMEKEILFGLTVRRDMILSPSQEAASMVPGGVSWELTFETPSIKQGEKKKQKKPKLEMARFFKTCRE